MTILARCPSCGALMSSESFARHRHGEVVLDICWDCRAIWFDQLESAQLAPSAVIALFRQIHEHRAQVTQAYAEVLRCPRCGSTLELTHDMQRNNRLRYHRCPKGCGRFTAFMQFLREKDFVRSLSAPEIESLKATVSQVRCSSCGAVIDLARDTACGYCRAPLAVLDAAAVEKALAALTDADRKSTAPNAADIAMAFASMEATRNAYPRERGLGLELMFSDPSPDVMDLVVAGIGALFNRKPQ